MASNENNPERNVGWKAVATAMTAFSHQPTEEVLNPDAPSRRVKKRLSKKASLELTRSRDIRPVHEIAAQGSLEELKELIETFGVSIKERDDNGATLLHVAARHNRLAAMQYLIVSSDTSLNTLDNDGNAPLHVAVECGCIEAMHLLLNSGASDTILNKKMDAPLHIAVRSNNCDLVAGFLDHPIDLLVEGYRKRTPLHVISEHDNIEACEMVSNSVLMQQARQNNLRLCSQDEDKLTPLHLAARKGSHRVLDFLLSKCIQHGYPRETVLSFLDEENSTPLHAAIDGGNVEVVNVLLKYGANPTAIKEDQVPPLHLACSQGSLKMVELMVDHCGKEILQHRDQYGRPPLHYCTHAINSAQMIAYLAQNGADINSTCDANRMALHFAVISGNLAGTKELLSHGADPLATDVHGCNPLHYAVANNRKAIVKLFLELPCAPQLVTTCNKNHVCPLSSALKLGLGDLVELLVEAVGNCLQVATDEKGRSYLHFAASSGDWKALSILLKIPSCQKNINGLDEMGITPLHVAALGGHTHCVEVLLRHGAMIHKAYCGKTPFMGALGYGHPDCARVLFEAHPFQKKWADDTGETALHLAAWSCNPRCITLALDLGIPVTHNLSQESFFDFIIDHANFDCAMAVVNHERWQECLDCCSPHLPPPMLGLISRMPAVAQAVLDHCHMKSSLDSEHQGYWEKFSFKYLRLYSEKRDPDVDDATDAINPEHMDVTAPMIWHKLSIQSNTPPPPLQKATLPLEALRHMVSYKRVGLLTHPVVEAYLKMKWENYGRVLYLFSLTGVILHLIFLSVFILVAPNPAETRNVIDNTISSNSTRSNDYSPDLSSAANAMRILTLIFCTFNTLYPIIIFIGALKQKSLEGLKILWVWTHALAVLCTFIFLIPTKPIWEAGALAAFFTWFRVFLALQMFEVFGIYVTMFLAITQTVFQVLLICFLLLAAFALSLYILAGKVLLFSTFGYSLFTVFGYMLGEIQYELFVETDNSGLLQSNCLTSMFVIILAIILAIVMANLLIGLAVGDIENIKRNATAEKRSLDVFLLSRMDATLPKRFLKRFDKPSHMRYPNAHVSWIRQLWRIVWRTIKKGNTDQAAGGPTNLAVSQNHSSELAAIKQQLENLTVLMKHLHEAQQQQRNNTMGTSPEIELDLSEQ